jgi:hypothetical protein
VTTFVYAYPDGQEPTYWIHQDSYVLSYPQGDQRFFRNGELWHPLPQGGPPILREFEGYIYDYPTAAEPRFYLREVDQ